MDRPVTRILAAALLLVAAGGAQPQDKPPAVTLGLRFPAVDPIRAPAVETFTLPNGLRVLLAADRDLPKIHGFALVRTGRLWDPEGKAGLASVVAASLAGDMRSTVSDDVTELSFECLSSEIGVTLPRFAEALTAPAFRIDAVELAKNRLRTAIVSRNSDPARIVLRVAREELYGRDSPFGRRPELQDADDIEREAILAFYRRQFVPSSTVVALYGDFDSAVFKERLTALFASWTPGGEPVEAPRPRETGPEPAIHLDDQSGSDRSFFALGFLDRPRPALDVLAQLVLKSAITKLQTKLAEPRDFTAQTAGAILVAGSVRAGRTMEAVAAIQAELTRLRSEAPSSDDLEEARARALHSYLRNASGPAAVIRYMGLAQLRNTPVEEVLQYPVRLSAVTAAEVTRAAREGGDPARTMVVIAGNQNYFDRPVASLGLPVKAVDRTMPPAQLRDPPEDEEAQRAGVQILRRIQAALGGADRLAAVRDYDFVYDAELGGSGPARVRTRWLRVGVLRQDQQLPSGRATVFYNGKIGWSATGPNPRSLAPETVRRVQGELFRTFCVLPLADRNAEHLVTSLGAGAVYVGDRKEQSVRIVVDSETGLPLKYSYPGADQLITGWRDVDGVKAPARYTILRSGQGADEYTLVEASVNSGVTEEELSGRP